MQTPPTNDAAARAAAVKARWKRAVRAVQEPLTPSVADELPPYLLAEARDAFSEVTLRSGTSVGAPLRREHRAARPPPRTGRDWLTASERLQLGCWLEIGEYEARTWRRP